MSHQTTTAPEERTDPRGGARGFGPSDWQLFTQGRHARLYEKFGAHVVGDGSGVLFRVWAPNAQSVSVVGDFNSWTPEAHLLERGECPAIWETTVLEARNGSGYRFRITSQFRGHQHDRLDPFGTAEAKSLERHSLVWDLQYQWGDGAWMRRHGRENAENPCSVYQVHLGSWRRVPEENNRRLNYRESAQYLADHLERIGFTHVLLMDACDLGFGPDSQGGGFFSPLPGPGTPQDLMFLVDLLHQRGIGVLMDWTPAHFRHTDCGLAYFDGARLYEQSSWPVSVGNSRVCVFDFSRPEVRNFLLSSACFWLEMYHLDGLRMPWLGEVLYLNLRRHPGEWAPNIHGGREDLDGINFLRELNDETHNAFPGRLMIAGETDTWPLVSHPSHVGGLGFDLKEDDLFGEELADYFGRDPYFRKFHHNTITARSDRAFAERWMLSLADPTAAAGGSLLSRMHGDEWQRFANFRVLLGYFYLNPGKKILFMGTELAQWLTWNPEASLDWHLSAEVFHGGTQRWVGDLNHLYRSEPALHEADCLPAGFEWVDRSDAELGTASFLRRDSQRKEVFLAVFNFTPVLRRNFRVGVRRSGFWREVLNSDAGIYGGSGQGNLGGVESAPFRMHDLPQTLVITLPPLSVAVFKHDSGAQAQNW